MDVTKRIKLDFARSTSPVIVWVKQGDENSRFVEIVPLKNGENYTIPSGVSIKFACKKPDGHQVLNDYPTISNNIITVPLSPQTLASAGEGLASIILFDDVNQKILSTQNFILYIEQNPLVGSEVESSDEYQSFLAGLLKVESFPEITPEAEGKVIGVKDGEYAFANVTNGKDGADGKSAYAYAKEGGYTGTEEEFAEKLATEYLEKDEMFYISTTVTPDYTNLIPFSTDTDGSVFNDTGYIADKTLRSDGSLGDNAGTFVSGFIPVKQGDIIRVKDTSQTGFESSLTFCLYSASQATATGIGKSAGYLNTVYGSSTIEGNVLTWDTSGIGYYPWTNFAYLRVTTFSANAIVTVNEELIESAKDELTLKPEVKVPVDNLSGELVSTPLAGETVVCFGDSLFGMYRDDSSTPAQIASKTGATVYNAGFGGCRMSVHPTSGYAEFCMWALAKAIAEGDWSAQDAAAAGGSDYFPEQLELLKGIDFNAVDSIVIHYGTNDFAAGVAVDNESDPDDYTTLCGALRYSIEKLLGAYPKLKIFVSLPVFRYWTASDGTVTYSDTYLSNGKTLPVFVEALRAVALEYNLPVIDGYYGMGINKDNASAFLSDGTHHNADGRKRFGEFIGAHLTSFGQTATKSGEGGSASIEVTAEVGQTIVVEEVDADGKPTKWKAAEYQPRTHYVDENGVVHKLDNQFIDAEWMATTETPESETIWEADLTFTSGALLNMPKIYPQIGLSYDVYWNGVKYTCVAYEQSSELYLGNGHLISDSWIGSDAPFCFSGWATGTPTLNWVQKNTNTAETITVTITTHEETTYNKLPKEFLPDNVAPYYITGALSEDASTGELHVTCNDSVENVVSHYNNGSELRMQLNWTYDGETAIFDCYCLGTMYFMGTLNLSFSLATNEVFGVVSLTPSDDGRYIATLSI